ncbi:hypothetical protein PILCRDRAFT_17319 [Piloderma croceum F 1598]|uniref:Uncharacterized protein n=1 Tax=Piloderma croceum (strain F 1598) TaxID=765440 RepID=A0A0C3ABL7_PILCF|nr:hypothetical protein PILCRDRAFT_17319 [Piloderma croceum F 1598]
MSFFILAGIERGALDMLIWWSKCPAPLNVSTTLPTNYFAPPVDIEYVRPVSAFWRELPHPRLISASRPPTTSTYIYTPPPALPLRITPAFVDGQAILGTHAQYLSFWA